MPGSFDKQRRDSHGAYRNWNMKLIALPVLGVVALIAFAISHPGASKWISDAAEAEFVGMNFVREPPTRLVRPNREVRTVKAY